MNTTTDIAWAAGFLDGEGCFTLLKRSGGVQPFQPYLGASQINPAPLQKLADLFGGRVRPLRVNDKGEQIHQWALAGGASVTAACDALVPYLMNKGRDAAVLRKFSQSVKRGNTSRTDEAVRREAIAEMAMLRDW